MKTQLDTKALKSLSGGALSSADVGVAVLMATPIVQAASKSAGKSAKKF